MIPWWRERIPTPEFWPGEFQRLYSPWGCKASEMTEWLSLHTIYPSYKLYNIFFSQWLISLSIISTMFICVVACGRISFLLKAESSSIIHSCHIFSPIHPSLDIWVASTFSYFYHATMKWVCKNILIRHFYWLFWEIYSELGLLDHILILFLIFWGSFIIFSTKTVLIYTSTKWIQTPISPNSHWHLF